MRQSGEKRNPINHNDLFKGITVYDFHVSVNDIVYEKTLTHVDRKTRQAITRYKDYVTDRADIDTDLPVWRTYETKLINDVILNNPSWPIHLPIGYVFVCFILNTDLTEYRLSVIKPAFEKWITQDNREKLHSNHRAGKFYIKSKIDHIGSLGDDLTDALYGSPKNLPPQTNLEL